MKKIIGSFLLLLGSLGALVGCKEKEMIFIPSVTEQEICEENVEENVKESEKILVYVCGAVKEAGVIAIEPGARMVDAVAAAGGMVPEADETYLNLAQRLTDGQKIYVPTKKEADLWRTQEKQEQKININTADKDELCQLPGIGERKAQDIIAYREKYGNFQKIEDLMKISGIKENLYNKLADQITVEQ